MEHTEKNFPAASQNYRVLSKAGISKIVVTEVEKYHSFCSSFMNKFCPLVWLGKHESQ